jgi:predicted regulator of Ras-like GTPase activity (Roadblock/LC7/MglB family)
VKHVLSELNERITARGSVVMAPDGLLVASAVGEGVDLDRLAALGADILTGVGSCLKESELTFTHVEIATERGKVILVEAGPVYLLVLLGARLEIGPGSIEIRSAAQRVAMAALGGAHHIRARDRETVGSIAGAGKGGPSGRST